MIRHPSWLITGAKLPPVRQVLEFVLYATQKAETRNEAFEETIAEVKTFWDMARIETMEVKVCKKNSPSCNKNRYMQKSKTRVAGEKGRRS